VLAGVLLPVMLLVVAFARIESARLAAQQTARDAVRAATQAPTAGQADAAAHAAAMRSNAHVREPVRVALTGRFEPGQTLEARASARVALGSVPLLGDFGTITVRAKARAPVDRYRSLLPTAGAP
jgi:hypothetical protein